jgi:hypothetical protein
MGDQAGDQKLQNNQPSILKYPGFNGIESCCAVRRYGDTAIATELADNPGTSISDAIEIVATIIVDQFDIDPEKLQLIEEIPSREPRFSLVTLTRGDTFMHIQRVKFIGASWRQLSQAEVEALIGQPL